jgi:hypothetical protein
MTTPSETNVFCEAHVNYIFNKESDQRTVHKAYIVSTKYKCPYLVAVWVRVQSPQQMWHLLSKTNPSSSRSKGPISKHIHSLGTNTNLVVGPNGPEAKNDCAGEGQQQFTGPGPD